MHEIKIYFLVFVQINIILHRPPAAWFPLLLARLGFLPTCWGLWLDWSCYSRGENTMHLQKICKNDPINKHNDIFMYFCKGGRTVQNSNAWTAISWVFLLCKLVSRSWSCVWNRNVAFLKYNYPHDSPDKHLLWSWFLSWKHLAEINLTSQVKMTTNCFKYSNEWMQFCDVCLSLDKPKSLNIRDNSMSKSAHQSAKELLTQESSCCIHRDRIVWQTNLRKKRQQSHLWSPASIIGSWHIQEEPTTSIKVSRFVFGLHCLRDGRAGLFIIGNKLRTDKFHRSVPSSSGKNSFLFVVFIITWNWAIINNSFSLSSHFTVYGDKVIYYSHADNLKQEIQSV